MTALRPDFDVIYKRNFEAVYKLCYIYMQSVQDAEDCTEDTFLKLVNTNVTFNDEKHERAWLTVVAKNICKDKLRHWWRKKTEPVEQGEMACNPFAEENTLDDIIAAGLDVTIPEGAEIILCKVWENGQKDIRFELDGHKYYYSASGEDGDFSGIYDTAKETEELDNGAVLEYTSMGYYKIHWSGETYNYYFSNTDGADKDTVIELSELMAAQAQ